MRYQLLLIALVNEESYCAVYCDAFLACLSWLGGWQVCWFVRLYV